MTTATDPLDHISTILLQIHAVEAELDTLRGALADAIVVANTSGYTFQDMAERIGVTRQRVHQMTREGKKG